MNFSPIIHRLSAAIAADDYAGWDPFDALNSRLFRALQLHRFAFLRLCWLQFFKRSPINFRPIASVPKTENAKAISLLLRAALAQGDTALAAELRERMLALRVPQESWGGGAWGYPFDWQAKAFFVDTQTPNVICTAYCVMALREWQAATGDGSDGALFVQAAAFVQQHLARDGYIAYVPSSDALVYNASLWGAYVCLEGFRENGDEQLKRTAECAIANALAAQGERGEWIYGTASHHGFIDGFHTGYNLEALYRCNQLLQREDIDRAIDRGLQFYLNHCFEPDGRARYYADKLYPIDPHSAAQGILTLLTLDAARYQVRAAELAEAVIREMWNEKKGAFHYQKHARYTNRITYLRWTQAWMLLALARLQTSPQEK